MTEEMAALAAKLGKVDNSEGLKTLCAAAGEELKGMLKRGVTPEDCPDAFVLAGAWLALGALETAEGGVQSFRAGEVSIRKKDGPLRQKALRLQALQVMKPYIKDEGFTFRGVQG